MAIKTANALLAIIGGIGGAMLLYWLLNKLAESLPGRWEDRIKPWMFAGPAILAIGVYLIYPAIQTLQFSFANEDSTAYVGFKNYQDLLTDSTFLLVLLNNLLWIIVVPATTVVLGLGVAVLADRLRPTGEKLSKTFIFLPMAISMVAAATIWRSIYEYQPSGAPQTGLLNAIFGLFDKGPFFWYSIDTLHFNSLLLMIILIWTQVGYSMVLLSAAIKGVPEDTIEAARIDGATELQIFWRVVLPQIKGTMITVFVTVFITVLKVFDIVYVTTNGAYGTNVIANLFFNKLFAQSEAGQATAIVVVLLVAVIPLIWYQIKHFRDEEAGR